MATDRQITVASTWAFDKEGVSGDIWEVIRSFRVADGPFFDGQVNDIQTKFKYVTSK